METQTYYSQGLVTQNQVFIITTSASNFIPGKLFAKDKIAPFVAVVNLDQLKAY